MSTFISLLPGVEFGPVGAEQEHAARCLPNAVRSSRLCWWPDRQEVAAKGRSLVIGIAPYSRDDLRLLDALDEALERAAGDRLHVQVFSVLDCRGNRDADRFIPGLGAFFQTPLVGLWEDGELRAKGWGKQARDLLKEEAHRLAALADPRPPGAPPAVLRLSKQDADTLPHLPGYVVHGLRRCAPEVVSGPVAVYRGLKRGPGAPARLRHGWAFSGKPFAAHGNAGEHLPAVGMTFVVYADADGYVFDWDWVEEDVGYPGVPTDADLRFEQKVPTRSSALTLPPESLPGKFDHTKPVFSPRGDCLFCYMSDDPAFGVRINEDLTVFYALADRDRITGFKIKNVRRIMQEERLLDLQDAPGLRVLVLPVLRKLHDSHKNVTFKLCDLIIDALVNVKVPVQAPALDDCEIASGRTAGHP